MSIVYVVGIRYNDTSEVIEQAMKTSVKIWARGLEHLAKNPELLDRLKVHPRNSCNNTHITEFWKDGEHLYRYYSYFLWFGCDN